LVFLSFLDCIRFQTIGTKYESIGNIAKYTLLALWLISVALAISIGIKQAAAFTAADGRVIQKKILCYCHRYATH
jgi:hypothetical protein